MLELLAITILGLALVGAVAVLVDMLGGNESI